ncbi:MAG: PorT family protein [Bacteroidetes bacterium]|nr:PorT family protein [Bacteroidota bacterium]
MKTSKLIIVLLFCSCVGQAQTQFGITFFSGYSDEFIPFVDENSTIHQEYINGKHAFSIGLSVRKEAYKMLNIYTGINYANYGINTEKRLISVNVNGQNRTESNYKIAYQSVHLPIGIQLVKNKLIIQAGIGLRYTFGNFTTKINYYDYRNFSEKYYDKIAIEYAFNIPLEIGIQYQCTADNAMQFEFGPKLIFDSLKREVTSSQNTEQLFYFYQIGIQTRLWFN